MHQTRGAAVCPMMLALAMFLPIITGFGDSAPDSGAAVAPEAITAPDVQSPPPTTPEALALSTRSSATRISVPSNGATMAVGDQN